MEIEFTSTAGNSAKQLQMLTNSQNLGSLSSHKKMENYEL